MERFFRSCEYLRLGNNHVSETIVEEIVFCWKANRDVRNIVIVEL